MKVTQALDGEQVRQRSIHPSLELPLAYKIRGKVALSYAGALVLASRLDIKLSEPEAKHFRRSGLVVAIAKAYNPQTRIRQAGASQWDIDDWCALTIAKQLALRNAIRKVTPLSTIHIFANLNAVPVPSKTLSERICRRPNKRRH